MEGSSVALLSQSGIESCAPGLKGAVCRGDKYWKPGGMVASSAVLSIFFNQSKSPCDAETGCSKARSSKDGAGVPPKLFNQPTSSCDKAGCAGAGAGVSPKLLSQLKSSCDAAGWEGAGSSTEGEGVPPKLFSQLRSSCEDEGCAG